MGIYVYGLRKSKIKAELNEVKVKVQYFQFLYKPWGLWDTNCKIKRSLAFSERAFEDYDGGYIVVGSKEDNLNGHSVYKNLTKATYFDSDVMPAEYVGYLECKGRSCKIIPAVYTLKVNEKTLCVEKHPYTNGNFYYSCFITEGEEKKHQCLDFKQLIEITEGEKNGISPVETFLSFQ